MIIKQRDRESCGANRSLKPRNGVRNHLREQMEQPLNARLSLRCTTDGRIGREESAALRQHIAESLWLSDPTPFNYPEATPQDWRRSLQKKEK